MPAILERNLRNMSIIDQDAINRVPSAIIGVGAIGSHLAEMLVKMGVTCVTLIDFDEVDEVNLGVQGFYESDVGRPKVQAVTDRLEAINSQIKIGFYALPYEPSMIEPGSAVFCCVDSIKTRRQIFRHFCQNDWVVFLDGRMAAESLRVFTITHAREDLNLYETTMFPEREAYREACTAKATIYCATIAAAILCSQYKKWAMGQDPERSLQMDIMTMDIYR